MTTAAEVHRGMGSDLMALCGEVKGISGTDQVVLSYVDEQVTCVNCLQIRERERLRAALRDLLAAAEPLHDNLPRLNNAGPGASLVARQRGVWEGPDFTAAQLNALAAACRKAKEVVDGQ